ncbi:MAG TPA: type II toxin-antitoxin system VapC family toxin [Candidatus Limnocylindria bacterium]|nr:type II toxin-antitoxin system VapC family toxin [Candidatus Limnocylindria bacterium]
MVAGSSFVVDASIALSWCFEDEASTLAEAVLERLAVDSAVAPAIWPLEVANGLRAAERRGRIDERAIPAATQLLLALPIWIDEAAGLQSALGEVLQTARAVGVSVYDATYLDLALRRGVPLATADEQLARAARAAGIQLVENS